jgi:hypothetical protein
MCIEVALSKSGGGVYLLEAITELARASCMEMAAVERELRVARVSAWRMSRRSSRHGGSTSKQEEVFGGEARPSASCLVLPRGGW